MIVSDACTINASLVFALALASVINYAHKWCHSLERHLLMTLVVIHERNMFIVQATGQRSNHFTGLNYDVKTN